MYLASNNDKYVNKFDKAKCMSIISSVIHNC